MRKLLTHILFHPLANLAMANRVTHWMRANGDGDDVCNCSFNVTDFVNTNKHRRQKLEDSQQIQKQGYQCR